MRVVFALVAVLVLVGFDPVPAGIESSSDATPLSVRQDLDCTSPIPLEIGDSTSGDNSGAPANVTAYPPCFGSAATILYGEVVYEVTIDGPDCQAFGAVLSDHSCNLYLYLLGSCDEMTCLDSGWSSIVTDCLDPGTYYLVLDGWECYYELETYDWTPVPHCCPILDACYTFDFNTSSSGFTTQACGGSPVWQWGPSSEIPEFDCGGAPVANVLGTILDDIYPNNAGQAAVIGPVSVTADCACMELCHFYDIEEEFDGGNVKISTNGGSTWEIIYPASAYDTFTRTAFWEGPRCLPCEPAFSREDSTEFVWDCFDLSPYIGSDVMIGFFFGSGDSTRESGWYLKSLRIGDPDSPVERRSWGAIKGLYR